MSSIPKLSTQAIRALAGEQTFQRGEQYFRNGAIFNPLRQGMILRAYCEGSRADPYRLQVNFDATGVAGAICSCPMGRQMVKGYYCKHVVALLLTWQEQPEKFVELEDLETMLERRSKAELIDLIKYIFQQQPEFEWLLVTSLPTDHKRKMTVDPEIYSSQVDAAFDSGGHEWDAVYGISSDLYGIMDIASGFARQNDYANAAIIYEVVAMETLGHYFSYHDEDGALGRVVQDCVEKLGGCLGSLQEDKAAREKIIQTIFSIYRFDVDKGGYGFTDEIPLELVQHTTPEEKRIIAGWVEAALSEIQGGGLSDNWHRRRYGGLLLALEAETLSDEEYLRIGHETGRVYEVVNRLLERGRVDEAARETEQADERYLLKLADLFVHYGQNTAIEHVMQERARQAQRTYIAEWLKKYYLDRNNTAAALEIAELIFRKWPRLEGYQEIRELATQLGTWETRRQALLTFLETSQETRMLAEVALDERELDKALELLKLLRASSQNRGYGQPSTSDYGYYNVALRAAKAAEETRPDAAIEIYRQYVETLINQKGRGSYQEACRYLLSIRGLYEKLGESETWAGYIADLRQRYSRLRALKEELAAAKL